MKKLLLAVACIALVGLAPCAYAAQVALHGDLNNRFQVYNDQYNFFPKDKDTARLDDATAQYVDVKYRLWAEMATDDNAVKGVYAIEVGGFNYGSDPSGDYSGDGTNVETRWAYTDFMMGNGRLKIGLQPWEVNRFIWKETATAIRYDASPGGVDYSVGWARGKQYLSDDEADAFIEDSDALLGRVNFGIGEGSKAGVFVLYQMANPSESGTITSNGWGVKNFDGIDISIWTLGVDGKMQTAGPLFVSWDLIYQNGKIENAAFEVNNAAADRTSITTTGTQDFDLNAYLAHVDVGVKLGKMTLTYTGWYASGDSESDDDDFEGFLSTDTDTFDSIIFFEGGYTDENYFTDRPHLRDKGLFMNRLGADFQATDKTKVGGALLYVQTAEDIEYLDSTGVLRSSSDLGIEVDAYISYQMYKNLELALNAGYLLSGDAMDFFETTRDGSSDEDVFRSTARIRYKF